MMKLDETNAALQKRGLCGGLFTSAGKDYYCLRMPHPEDPERHAAIEVLRLPVEVQHNRRFQK